MIKIPKMHLPGSVIHSLGITARFSKQVLEQIKFGTIQISILPIPQFVEIVAEALVSIIRFKGNEGKARKILGPKWDDRVRKAVYHDFLSSLYFCVKVLSDSSYFFERSSEYFNQCKFLPGSINMMKVLSASTEGFTVPGTGNRFFFEYSLRNTDYIFNQWLNKHYSIEEVVNLKKTEYRVPEYFGILQAIKNELAQDIILETPVLRTGIEEPLCIGDVLITNTENPSGSYLILSSEGVSPISVAFNLIYRPKFLNSVVTNINLHGLTYMQWSGEPSPEVRSFQIEIWLGIPYNLADLRSSNELGGGNGPQGSGPNLPINPDPISPDPGNTGSSSLLNKPTRASVSSEDSSIVSEPSVSEVSNDGTKQKSDISSHPLNDVIENLDEGIKKGKWSTVKSVAKTLKDVTSIALPLATYMLVDDVRRNQNPEQEIDIVSSGGSINLGPANLSRTVGKGKTRPIRVHKK